MKDSECVEFLQWALPQLGLRWPGFRNVRRQVCRRVKSRMRRLGLDTFAAYRDRLNADQEEWEILDGFCRVTISRFYRDKRVFDVLGARVLPDIAGRARRHGRNVRLWSAGCASGEEVYTLAILWNRRLGLLFPGVGREIVASESNPGMIARAKRACYAAGSLRDMPEAWRTFAFERSNGCYCVRRGFRRDVTFLQQDIRRSMPEGTFDLVLCRNLAFTYFAADAQLKVLAGIDERLRPSGYLVVGAHEALPDTAAGFAALPDCEAILRRSGEA